MRRRLSALWRDARSPELWLIVVAASAASAGVPWWITVPLTVAGLSISSLPKYLELWPRAREVGAEREWWMTVAQSSFNALAAACAAHVLGVLVRWLWF